MPKFYIFRTKLWVIGILVINKQKYRVSIFCSMGGGGCEKNWASNRGGHEKIGLRMGGGREKSATSSKFFKLNCIRYHCFFFQGKKNASRIKETFCLLKIHAKNL